MSTSATVDLMSTVRNKHTGKEEKVVDIDRLAGRYLLSCDAPGRAKDSGWSEAGLNEHWEHVESSAG